MSALNSKETEQLQDAQTVMHNAALMLKTLVEAGVTAPGVDKRDMQQMERRLRQAEDGVKTVKTMKGHYPS